MEIGAKVEFVGLRAKGFNEATAISCGDLTAEAVGGTRLYASTRPQRLAVEIGYRPADRRREGLASTRPQRLAVEIYGDTFTNARVFVRLQRGHSD